MLDVIDAHGFAGGLTLGIMQGGNGDFRLVGKKELPGAFGAAQMEGNRHLLPGSWETQAAPYAEWEVPPFGADLVFGNPPCSGFSMMSTASFRGPLSKANACMWGVTEYAARVRPAIFLFESVQGAYRQGLELMRQLRARLEELSDLEYTLTHVLHSARGCGAPQLRRRYLFVASRVPFGVREPDTEGLPTVEDAIGDLAKLPLSWDSQPYQIYRHGVAVCGAPSSWARARRRPECLVDGHMTQDSAGNRRIGDLLATTAWHEGEAQNEVIKRCWGEGNSLAFAPLWERKLDALIDTDFRMGWNQPHRLRRDRVAPVMTGAALEAHVHYSEPRMLTHREVARIMGFPDNWQIGPLREVKSLRAGWGKGVTVNVGRWVGDCVAAALRGDPYDVVGDVIGERERLVDLTYAWKRGLQSAAAGLGSDQ